MFGQKLYVKHDFNLIISYILIMEFETFEHLDSLIRPYT